MNGCRALVLTTICILWSTPAAATWARQYEPLRAGRARAVAPLPDGGAVVYARGFVRALIRIDKRGEVVAARQLESDPDLFASGAAGEIFIGRYASPASEEFRGAAWIARLDADLSFRWARRVMAAERFPSFLIMGIAATRDGGVLVSGREGNASFVLKLGSTGDLEWSRTIDPSDEDELSAVHETRDGGAVCAGRSRRGPWLVKLDRGGNVSWQRTFPADGQFRDVLETEDGGVLAVGRVGKRAVVVKTAGDGAPRWEMALEGLAEVRECGTLPGGRFALSGSDAANRTVLVEIAADGAAGWRRRVIHEPIAKELPEHGRFAATADAVYLAPSGSDRGLDGHVYALRVDLDGKDACGWLGAADDVKSIASPLPANELSFTLPEPSFVIEKADGLSLTPLSLTSAEMTCDVVQQAAAAPTPKVSNFRGRVEERERMERYRALLLAKEYDALDDLAAKFRREQTRQDPMWWEIIHFYDAIVGDNTVPEATRLERLRAWADARPASIAARIALAMELGQAAWTRRGAGYADTVTTEGWAEYQKLLSEAMAIVAAIPKDAQNDPRYWSLLVTFARQTGEGDVREILRRAAAAGQHEPKLFQEVGFYLHPRWGGSGAEYRAFAEEAAALTRATFGDGMYTWLAYQAMFASQEKEYAEDYAFDWARMKRGFEDIIKRDPHWLPSHHRYALTASRFGDRKVARRLFKTPELDWYDGAEAMWRERKTYDSAREWALRTPVEPFIESAPATIKASMWKPVSVRARAGDMKHWPQIVLQGERTAGASVHRQVGFLLRSEDRVAAVTSFPLEGDLADRDNAIRTAWERTTRWTMWAPDAPRAKAAVTAIETVDPPNPCFGVAVTVDVTKPMRNLHVLRTRPGEDLSSNRRYYVVGCRWKGSRCEQIVVEGVWAGESSSGVAGHLSLGLYETFDAESFVGAPVLDEDGWVIGVSNGPDGSYSAFHAQILRVNFLTPVLRR